MRRCRGPAHCLLLERLDTRRVFAGSPYNLVLGDRLVSEVASANNLYAYGTPVIKWNGLDGQTVSSVQADCSTFITSLLKEAYKFSSSQFTTWTGSSSPQAEDFYNAAAANKGFTGYMQIANVVPGDFMFTKYLDSTTDTGHCVMIDQAPVLVSTTSTQKAYTIVVVDVTGSPHTNDTRSVSDDTGVGRGTMKFYTDLSGNLTAYSWGTSSKSVIQTPDVRPAIFAKAPAPATYSPIATWFSGGSPAYNYLTHELTVTGSTTISSDPGNAEPQIVAASSSSVITINPSSALRIHLGGINLTNGATLKINSLGASRTESNHRALVIGTPGSAAAPTYSVDTASTIDLNDNDLIILYGNGTSPFSATRVDIKQAYNLGTWTGTGGVTSTTAKASPQSYGLGYAEASTLGLTTFDTVALGGNAVIVKYTLVGDADMSGSVDLNDYSQVIQSFGLTGLNWTDGNFDYSGNAGLSDYSGVIRNFGNAMAASVSSGTLTTKAVKTAASPAASPKVAKVKHAHAAQSKHRHHA